MGFMIAQWSTFGGISKQFSKVTNHEIFFLSFGVLCICICKAGKYSETPNISKWVLPSHLNESLTGHKILG